MKLIIHIIVILFLTLNVSAFAEKKDCSTYKKFSKDHIACKAHNFKNGTKNTAGKIKKKNWKYTKSNYWNF